MLIETNCTINIYYFRRVGWPCWKRRPRFVGANQIDASVTSFQNNLRLIVHCISIYGHNN